VLYLYLVPHVIVELKGLLLAFLERGGRVVTYVHNLGYVASSQSSAVCEISSGLYPATTPDTYVYSDRPPTARSARRLAYRFGLSRPPGLVLTGPYSWA
jgi:hypothetical protein